MAMNGINVSAPNVRRCGAAPNFYGATKKVALIRQITLVVRGATMVVAVFCAEAMMARTGSSSFS